MIKNTWPSEHDRDMGSKRSEHNTKWPPQKNPGDHKLWTLDRCSLEFTVATTTNCRQVYESNATMCTLQGVKKWLLFCSQVDPAPFWSMCAASSSRASCRLAHAFIYLCQQNYIPLEVPAKCCKLILYLCVFMWSGIIVTTKHMVLTSGLFFCFVFAAVATQYVKPNL